ncbi:molybdopterin-guanine dinucleotide biosynthesis protein MobA [Planctomycetes bacterium Poly30]|uniref:Molybdopterin-guanine dinucleotide biosynthesis protein MobA n=1 Tax=Saltatorellus ferox TaxID=2528018 RepID=A0A518EU47_9BACT|nr:molybdopterin-guanine dinucleotide biosynthesis protein MobA [Planctomycetes bacterium Poly30]
MSLAAVILAGGASSRLGEPKALATIGGATVLARMLAAIAEGLTPSKVPALVVTGAHHGPISAFLSTYGEEVAVVENRDWASGRTSSVQAAAREREGLDLLLWPADVPLVSPRVLRAIEERWQALQCPATGWLAPLVEAAGRRGEGTPPSRYGHPIVIGRELVARVSALSPTEPLRSLRPAADPLAGVRVDEPAVLDDLDTPEDLARLRARWTRFQE